MSCLKCGDVCNCINMYSSDGSVIIVKNGCSIDLKIDQDDILNYTLINQGGQICLQKAGVTVSCIPFEPENQFITLNGNLLTLSEGGGTVDLSSLNTPFAANSSSLVITPGGVAGHSPNIEIVPSSNPGNVFILGSDGKPYVQGMNVVATGCFSFVNTVVGGIKTSTLVVDPVCLAALICPLCTPAPPVFTVTPNCGAASISGSFVVGTPSNGTISLPISVTGSGTVSVNIANSQFSGTVTQPVSAGNTTLIIPIQYNGSGVAGTTPITVPLSTGGSCVINATLTAVIPPFAVTPNCGGALANGTFVAGTPSGGTITVPITVTGSGTVTANVSANGFTGSASQAVVAGSSTLTINVAYDGTGTGTVIVPVTINPGGSVCNVSVVLGAVAVCNAPTNGIVTDTNLLEIIPNCSGVVVTGTFNAGTPSAGTITIPVSVNTSGSSVVQINISMPNFTGVITPTVTNATTSITVPLNYDGGGTAGIKNLLVDLIPGDYCTVPVTVNGAPPLCTTPTGITVSNI